MTSVVSRVVGNAGIVKQTARLLKVKSGEGRPLTLLGCAMFCIMAGNWLGYNAIDAMLSAHFKNNDIWPYLLIGRGLMAIFVIAAFSGWLNRLDKSVLLAATHGLIAIFLVGAWVAIRFEPPDPFFFVLYTIAYIIPELLFIQSWGLAGEVFDTRQSKRLFPLVTAGDNIGIVVGNFGTAPIRDLLGGGALGVQNILLVWAVLVIIAYLLLRRLRRRLDKQQRRQVVRRRREDERGQSLWSNMRFIVRYYPLLGLLALAKCLSAILYFTLFLDYRQLAVMEFKGDAGSLAGFFGFISGLAYVAAFVLSLFLSRLIERFGVNNFVLVTPTINLISFCVISVAFNLPSLIIVRFFLQISIETVSKNGDAALYNLVPPEAGATARAFNQGLSRQLGICLAGVLALIFMVVGLTYLTFFCIILAVIYFLTAWRMRARYRPALVQLLKEGQQDFFQNSTEDDAAFGGTVRGGDDALEVAINGLRDSSEGTRRLSAELLGKIGALEGVNPLLRALMTDHSAEVRRTAIVSLRQLNAPEAYPSIAEALQDPDSSVRAEAAAALRHSPNGIDRISFFFLRKTLSDTNALVRRQAILSMIAFGQQGEALYVLWNMGRDDASPVRREAAFAYGMLADKSMMGEVIRLLEDDDPTVRKQAALSLARFDSNKAVEVLMQALEDDSRAVREAAAASLAHLSQRSSSLLVRYLITTDNLLGQGAALQALSLIKHEESRLLAGPIGDYDDDNFALPGDGFEGESDVYIDYAVTINESENGYVPHQQNGFKQKSIINTQDEERLLDYGQGQLELARRLREYIFCLTHLDLSRPSRRGGIKRDPEDLSLLLKSLQERYDSALDRLVRVVGVLGNVEAVSLVASGLRSLERNARRQRADALETLENFGDSRLTPGLIQLLEVEDQNTLPFPVRPKSMIETLVEIWLENDMWLRACVLHVAGLFDLQRLRSLVEQVLMIDGDSEPWVYEAALDAQRRLDYPHNAQEEERLIEVLIKEKDMQTLGTLSTMSRILFLQKVPLFANLSPEDLRRIALVSKERLFAPGEIVCYEGDEGDELYIIVTGRVQVIAGYGSANPSGLSGGSGRTLHIYGEGDYVGDLAILTDDPRSATLRAYNSPVRLLTLGGDEFKRILRERPELAVEVIRQLSRNLREANRRVQEMPSPLPGFETVPLE